MDENRDRLIDILLREELGGEHPPDLADKIIARAFPGQRSRPLRLRFRAYLAAACILLAVGAGAWFWLRPAGYPEPRASGHYEVVQGGAVRRGATLATKDRAATLELGGYSQVDIKPSTTVRIDGEKFAESIYLESGTVQSTVERGAGKFTVRSPVGTVAVTGTEFLVRVVEEKGDGGVLEKRMLVQVLAGTVLVIGPWGEVPLNAGAERTFRAGEKKQEPKEGTIIGIVTAKGETWIEVRADGEEKARRYVPNWVGGAPAQGGGLDKDMLRHLREVPIGARVRLDWKLDESFRVVRLEVLRRDDKKEPKRDEKK